MAALEAGPERNSWPRSLPDDITREIFARAHYNDPVYIAEVSRLCRDWHSALSDAAFGDRLRAHRALPLPVGILHASDDDDQGLPTFIPTLRSPFAPLNVPDRRDWRVLDYRHGRGLFLSRRDGDFGSQELMVWDPISGLQRTVPVPLQASDAVNPGAALFCAVPGCGHRPTCNNGMFRIALLYAAPIVDVEDGDEGEGEEAEAEMRCLLYSSDTDAWAEEASLLHGFLHEFGRRPSAVAGQCVYFLSDGLVVFQLDLAAHTLTEVELPDMENWSPENDDGLILMVNDEGQLGLIESTDGNLFTWLRRVDDEGHATWKMIYTFDHYFTTGTIGEYDQSLLGFGEGTNTFFVTTSDGLFYFELPYSKPKDLNDLNVKRLEIGGNYTFVCPVVSMYPPYGPLQQGQQQNDAQQLLNNPNPDVPEAPAEQAEEATAPEAAMEEAAAEESEEAAAEAAMEEAAAEESEEAAAEAAMEEAAAEGKKRPNATCDETSRKRVKQDDGPMPGQGGPPGAGGRGGPGGAPAGAGGDETSQKRVKQDEATDPGKEQVLGDGQPAVCGRAEVKNSSDSGKRNGPRDGGTRTGAV